MRNLRTMVGQFVQNMHDALPRVLPNEWRMLESASDGAAYRRSDGLAVIASVDTEEDNKRWLHVSCSRASRLP